MIGQAADVWPDDSGSRVGGAGAIPARRHVAGTVRLLLNMATLLFAPQPLAYFSRATPYGADSEPRTSESGCAITYDVLFSGLPRSLFQHPASVVSPRLYNDPRGLPPCHELPSPSPRSSIPLSFSVCTRNPFQRRRARPLSRSALAAP